MPNENAMELAKDILDDLRGAAYYADPSVLQGRLGRGVRDEGAAIELLRGLLHRYATKWANDDDVNALADALEGIGVR